jgi:hypothetical protein
VVAILVIAIISLIGHGLGTLYSLRLAAQGIMDPDNYALATSSVRLASLASALILSLLGAVYLFFLRKAGLYFFLAATLIVFASMLFLFVTQRVIQIDAIVVAFALFSLVYGFRLSRHGFLR